jgi:hypothetical protein
VKRAAQTVGEVLRVQAEAPGFVTPVSAVAEAVAAEPVAPYAPPASDSAWPSYVPNGSGSAEPPAWS